MSAKSETSSKPSEWVFALFVIVLIIEVLTAMYFIHLQSYAEGFCNAYGGVSVNEFSVIKDGVFACNSIYFENTTETFVMSKNIKPF